MARVRRDTRDALDAPLGRVGRRARPSAPSRDRFGRATEWVARNMGTPWFLVGLSAFCAGWILWNTLAAEDLRFDSAAFGFTALTLVLSLQASYAAPLILLAQNRQDDRDRVQIEQDRQRAERNLADTEYLAREIVALRLSLTEMTDEVVTRDVLRHELRALLAEVGERADDEPDGAPRERPAARERPAGADPRSRER
ncbi:DUF1003 domain-containing protein [Microbacterium sp. LRZ72]|uniref:DUF1003 domain-containing protein n=1 Tax=Microbacterium sp. LRZ72 TaxID=2942481 RepID=UPI0029AFDE0F|nr:DUF1003 domain-containing protein [Microbacterium sp. LRZ72]MDX2375751.1 DUF1003 domain-containing protein [Microbacterium sp. LRZ72]